MLGGINNELFFQAFGGFFVVFFILIPLLRWISPNSDAEGRKLRRQLRKEVRSIKRKR